MRVGVIGCGKMGAIHARALARAGLLAGVADTHPDRAGALARELKCFAYRDCSELRMDAAVVATPTETHAEIAVGLLQAGIHVLVEKPMAATAEAAQLMLAAQGPAILRVGYIERHNPALSPLPRPFFADITRAGPGTEDVVLDLMIHDIDLLTWMAGIPSRVEAAGNREDATAYLEFADGSTAALHASRDRAVRRWHVFGEGTCSMDFGETRANVADEHAAFLRDIKTGEPTVDALALSIALQVSRQVGA